jgi:hypothetical protein
MFHAEFQLRFMVVGLVKNKLRAPLGESLRQLTGF